MVIEVVHESIYINIFMNYLSSYYKNLSEQLQKEVDFFQSQLNEVMSTDLNPGNSQNLETAGLGKWLDDIFGSPRLPDLPTHRPPQRPKGVFPDNWDMRKTPGKKVPDGPPPHLAPGKLPKMPTERGGHPINPLGGGVYQWAGQYWYLGDDGVVYRWSTSTGAWVPITPGSNHPFRME
jgi:hypothetical protein